MNDELIDLIDEAGTTIRSVSKIEAHARGWLHRTVIAEVRDRHGDIVLVRQAADRQDAGRYVCPVGGHVKSAETELAALHREAEEEIGISGFESHLVDRFIYERHVIGRHENHYFIVYQIIVDPAEIILGSESVEYRIFTKRQLKEAQRLTPEIFGDSYIALLRHTFPELLYDGSHT